MAIIMKPVNFTQLLDEKRDIYFIYKLAQEDLLYTSDINPVNRIISNSNELMKKITLDDELKRVIIFKETNDILQ